MSRKKTKLPSVRHAMVQITISALGSLLAALLIRLLLGK